MTALHRSLVVPLEGADAERGNSRKAQLETTTNVPTAISTRAESCLRRLNRWKSSEGSGTRADDALSLFRLWVINNFVFADDHMSLDWRLRHVEVLASVIADLLDELESSVLTIINSKRTGQAETYTVSELDAEAETPEDVQAQLFDICRAIHRSGIVSRFSKLAHYQHILQIEDKEINLTQAFRKGIGEYVDARYRKASEAIRLRLAESISLRRQNFLYLRDREAKARGEAAQEKDSETELGPVFTSQNEVAKDQGPTMPTSTMQKSSGSRNIRLDQGDATKRQPSPSIFSASTVNPHKAMKPASARSASIFAASSHLGISKMIPPPPPKTGTGYIECPYCFLICREEEMRNEYWERHFLRDLMPYVCLLDDCNTPDVLFDSSKRWSNHMISQHPITTWICANRTHHQTYRFRTSGACRDHMMAQHAHEFDRSDLSEIVEASKVSQPRTDPLTWCPICGDDFDADSKPADDILRHVAEHLVELAFCSLPADQEEEGGESETESDPSLLSSSFERASVPQTGIGEESITGEYYDIDAEVFLPEIEPFYHIADTAIDHWEGYWEDKPLPIYDLPNEPALLSLDHGQISAEDESTEGEAHNQSGKLARLRQVTRHKKLVTFVEGTYGKDLEPKTSKLRRLVDRAINTYNYDTCPLPKDQLRLLFLKPSKDRNNPIIVKLQAFPIKELVEHPNDYQFTALSYNWGGGGDDSEILVDISSDDESPVQMKGLSDIPTVWKRRMKPIRVKPNLHAFLREFRHPTEEVALWVDRICINQANNEEKADQVSKMGIIYSTATNVTIWLGTADDNGKSDRAMDFIGSMLKQDVEQKLKDASAQDEDATKWSDLLSLMRRRWFSRRWVIQELALAKNAEVRCGSKRVHWLDFSDAVRIFELHSDIIFKIIKRRPDIEGINDTTPCGARMLVDVLSKTFQRDSNGTIFSPRHGLESLISSLSTFKTSDPRDTIYALLSLAKETSNLPSEDEVREEEKLKRNEANPPPFPDYSADLLDVYTNFMKWCIRESGSLDILCRHWALPEVNRKPDKFYPELVELPSWIKTVRKSAYGSQQEGFGGRKKGDSFVGSPENRCYNASLNILPNIQWGRDRGGPSPESPNTGLPGTAAFPSWNTVPGRPRPHVLSIKGFYLGQVSKRYQMPEGIITKEVLETLGHDSTTNQLERVPDALWRTLVADRGPDGKAPPAWYHRACMTCLVSDTSQGNMDTNQILQQKGITDMQADYLKRVQAVCWNRTFIECGDGDDGNKLFGIAPVDVKAGDLVCILYGCSVPCILRQNLHGSKIVESVTGPDFEDPRYFYELIGEAFILGHMDGEAIMDLSEEDLRSASDDFHLV